MWDKILGVYFKGDIEDLVLKHAKSKYITNAKKIQLQLNKLHLGKLW